MKVHPEEAEQAKASRKPGRCIGGQRGARALGAHARALEIRGRSPVHSRTFRCIPVAVCSGNFQGLILTLICNLTLMRPSSCVCRPIPSLPDVRCLLAYTPAWLGLGLGWGYRRSPTSMLGWGYHPSPTSMYQPLHALLLLPVHPHTLTLIPGASPP